MVQEGHRLDKGVVSMSGEFHFTDALIAAEQGKGSCVVVGLDTDPRRLPQCLMDRIRADPDPISAVARAQIAFNEAIIDAVHAFVPAVKLQIAYYELLGAPGIEAYQKTIRYAHGKGLLVIGDIKRADIGSTAGAYAEAHLAGENSADSVTVNPYLGSDGILPFLEVGRPQGKGVFVLVKTSNPSSSELQDLEVSHSGQRNYEVVARKVGELGADSVGKGGFSLVCAVVGATFPSEAEHLRKILPHIFFLVPGYGAQGAGPKDVAGCFNASGVGAVVNASRSIIYAYEKAGCSSLSDVGNAAALAVRQMTNEINNALRQR
jgi:orotidine-5'-phosphate decarboxylase